MEGTNIDEIRHWVSFGKRGRAQATRVKKDDWRAENFSKPETTPWELPLPEDAVGKLLLGFKPMQMEDKWFVYTDGPDAEGEAVVHMVRSWTGFPIADIKVRLVMGDNGQPEDSGAKFTEFTWETDKEKVVLENAEKAKEMVLSVCTWVLGIRSLEEKK